MIGRNHLCVFIWLFGLDEFFVMVLGIVLRQV